MSRYPPVAKFKNPIAGKDVAETFAESDVTLTHTKTKVANESLGLKDTDTSIADRPADDNSYNTTTNGGVVINPNTDLSKIDCTISSNTSGSDSVSAYRQSDGVQIDSVSGSFSGGDVVTLQGTFSSGVKYNVICESGDHTIGYLGSPSFPYTSNHVDIVNGADGKTGTTGRAESITDVTGHVPVEVGDVKIEWPYPSDIYRWDAATYQHSLDGETVEIYIEENDGSGWTEIAGPIERGQEITADPANECRFRVDLSRANTANNPTLDAIYRRWVL